MLSRLSISPAKMLAYDWGEGVGSPAYAGRGFRLPDFVAHIPYLFACDMLVEGGVKGSVSNCGGGYGMMGKVEG